MSWKATVYVSELINCPNGERLVRDEKLLLFVLADHADRETGEAWPSVATMASESLMSERHARDVLRSLESKGVIESDIGGGRGKASKYTFIELRKLGTPCRLSSDKPGINPAQTRHKPGTVEQRNKEELRTIEPEASKPTTLSNPPASTAGVPNPISENGQEKPAKKSRKRDSGAVTKFELDPEKAFAKMSTEPWEISTMVEMWNLYLEKTQRSARTYLLTEARARMGLARLRDAHAVSASIPGRTEEKIRDKARLQFMNAITHLAEDEFLNGANDRQREYIEWDKHLCKDWGTFEKRRDNR